MSLRPLVLPAGVAGRVWLSAMPGRFEPWDAFIVKARRAAISHVVCLTPLQEIANVSPTYQRALDAGQLPFEWLHLPMRDFGLAFEPENFREGVVAVAEHVNNGGAMLLHCAAGIGRTGTAAACLLKTLGMPTALALQRVREAGSNPQSALQSGLIELF